MGGPTVSQAAHALCALHRLSEVMSIAVPSLHLSFLLCKMGTAIDMTSDNLCKAHRACAAWLTVGPPISEPLNCYHY